MSNFPCKMQISSFHRALLLINRRMYTMKQLNQIKTEQIQGKSIKKSQCLWGDDFINSFVTKVVFISHFWRFFVVFSSYESDCLCNQIIFFSLHFLRSLTRQEDDIKSIILLDKYGNSRWIRLLIKVSFA